MTKSPRTGEPHAASRWVAKVLVVDDHEENLVAIRSILEKLDCQVMEAMSGADALGLILKHDFAVILLDVMMPVMDGFETARYIRDRKASKDTPIIFLTANGGDAEYISKGYSEGAVDYLVKPIDAGIVKAKVAVFIDLFHKEQRILRQEEALRAAERERGDAALRQSEAFYEATFDHAPVGIAHADANGHWLRVNDRFCEILRYEPAELLNMTFRQLADPKDVELDPANLRERLEGGRTWQGERRWRRKDGRAVWVHVTVSLSTKVDYEGHFIVIVEDVSERKLDDDRRHFLTAASEVLLSSLDYEVTIGTLAGMVVPAFADWWLVEVALDQARQRELFVRHRDGDKVELVRAFGRRILDDLASKTAGALRTRQSELVVDLREMLGRGAADRETLDLARMIGADSIMIVPLNVRDHALGTIVLGAGSGGRRHGSADLAMAEDLAHRVAFALDNARLYREAQSAIDARDEFLSIASHELRTPLTPLLITFQRLLGVGSKDSLDKIPSDRLKSMLSRSDRQVQRLIALIDSLLDVSRITAGGIQLTVQEFDLVEAARDVVARFGDELARAHSELRFSNSGPVRGRWDRLRMEQVVTNLVANSVKYGCGKPIQVSIERAGRDVVLSVKDEGIGIEADKIPRLFGRFERAVPSRSYGGLGLGLYIARQIVEAHGGSIRVSSQVGVGSVFTVQVPLDAGESAASFRAENGEERPNEPGIASR